MGLDAKYVVRLTDDGRAVLEALVKAPRVARAKVLRARMLLKIDMVAPPAEKIVLVQDNLHTGRKNQPESTLPSYRAFQTKVDAPLVTTNTRHSD